jgi:Rod binding domain-containing protein
MSEFSKNIELNSMNTLLGARADELSRKAETRSTDKSNLSDAEKSKFAKVSRGFEAMFVNMLLKEMKSAMIEEKDSEFSGPLQEYTDMIFSEHVASQDSGIGIAEKVYQFLTGEELPKARIIQPVKTAAVDFSTQQLPERKLPIENPQSNVEITKKVIVEQTGNFLDKVKNRLEVYDSIIDSASEKFGVPKELIKAVITAESAGHNHAKSKVGAKGLMQLMDGTARELGVTDSYDPAQNIYGGTLYLRRMLDKFGNNQEHALAAYNAGPGNVQKYGGIPPFRETESYVKKVNKYLHQFQMEGNDNQGINL